jgi:uncharacterized protein YehS (DUF1456 family)
MLDRLHPRVVDVFECKTGFVFLADSLIFELTIVDESKYFGVPGIVLPYFLNVLIVQRRGLNEHGRQQDNVCT